MASFFEKLKKGMKIKEMPKAGGADETGDDNGLEENEAQKPIKSPAAKESPKKEKPAEIKKEKKPKKIEEKPKLPKRAEPEETTAEEKPEMETPTEEPAEEKEETFQKKIRVKEEGPEIKEKPFAAKKEKSWFEPEGQLAIDLYQTDNEIVVQAAIAGVRPEDLDISIEKDVVSIRGKREQTTEKMGKNYFYQECYWGHFSREIILPSEVDALRAEATLKEGILTLRMPKIEREGKRKVPIRL